MRKKLTILFLSVCLLTACSNHSIITTGNKQLPDAVYNNEYVSLAPYSGLKAEKKNYIVTEKAVENEIHDLLSDYADYKSITRPSIDGDLVGTNFTAYSDGKTIMEENDYYFTLGEQEYGAEFDERLTGVTAGDKLDFTIDYDADFSDMDLAGKTVDFKISITDIKEEIMPELTDEFIKKHTSCDTYEKFTDSVRESIADSYESESTDELQEELLRQVVEASSILQYSKKDYDMSREEYESGCLEMFGMFDMDLDEIYEALDLSKEEVENDIKYSLYRGIVIDAILQNENITLSDDDYEKGIAHYMKENDYDSKSEFINDYGEDDIRNQLLEDKVLKLLEEQADITNVDAEYDI